MQLKEFSFISPVIESADVFQAIETVISPDVIEQTLDQTNSVEERQRKLPSQLVVCLVIAMSLWSSDSMGTVLKNLINGLSRQWTRLGTNDTWTKVDNALYLNFEPTHTTEMCKGLSTFVQGKISGKYWRVPNSSSITEARQRVGCRVMSQLFERVVRPLATPQTPGAFLGGLRVMAVDGTVFDVPDSQANAPCLWVSS